MQVPIGSEMGPGDAGKADMGMSYPPVVEQGEAQGLHIVFSVTAATRPHLFSGLTTTREYIEKNPAINQKVLNALKRRASMSTPFPKRP